jgi:hypothetical protein
MELLHMLLEARRMVVGQWKFVNAETLSDMPALGRSRSARRIPPKGVDKKHWKI